MALRTAGRRWRLLVAVVVLGVASLVTVSCGEDRAVPSSTSRVDPLADPVVDATAVDGSRSDEEPESDEGNAQLADAAVLRPSDYPGGWTVRAEGGGTEPGSCFDPDGDREGSLRPAAVHRGPTIQLDDQPAHITSVSYVFEDQDDALAWIDVVGSDEWAGCTAAAYSSGSGASDAIDDVVLETRTIELLGENGFEAYAEFHVLDPEGRIVGVVSVMHYRLGRVVLEETLERSTELDDADWAAVDSAHTAALASAWARLTALGSER